MWQRRRFAADRIRVGDAGTGCAVRRILDDAGRHIDVGTGRHAHVDTDADRCHVRPAAGGVHVARRAAGVTPATLPATTVAVPSAPPDALGLTAVIDQFREDEILHLLQVRVTNTSVAKVRITSVQLDWPGFTVVAPTSRDDLLSPGQTLDVPIDFGVAVCTQDPPGVDEPTPTAAAVARATVVPGDSGASIADVIPVADRLHIFDRVFPRDCRDQRVAAVADIHFGTTWTPTTRDGQTALSGTIEVLRRRDGVQVALTRLDGSVLLSVYAGTAAQSPVLTLQPGVASASVPIVVVQSGNCEPHALTESKKTFFLPVQVSINGDPSLPYELIVDPAARPPFTQMINTSCGVG